MVQHISNFTWLAQSKSWVYSFTQEWPVDPAPKNQLSYTLLRCMPRSWDQALASAMLP